MREWSTSPVGALCNLVNGRAFKPEDWSSSGAPIIRIQNLNDESKPFNHWNGPLDSQVKVQTGDVLLAWSGTPGTSFGAHIWNRGPGILNQHIFRVDLDTSRVDKRWWVFAVNHKLNDLIAVAHGGVGLKHVTRGMVDRLRIPLPPLEEQRRIAAILDAADALRAKRRTALAKLDTLAQSIFIEMFGDPVVNPFNWKRVRFGDLLESIDGGWSPACLERPASVEEWGVLKLGAVTWCQYDDVENKALPPSVAPRADIEVRAGDLLFTRKNTHELVAACAYVRRTRARLMMSDLIFRLNLKAGAPVSKLFLWKLLTSPSKRKSIQRLAGGAAGSMPNISKGRLVEEMIELPPLALQADFEARMNRLAGSQERATRSANALDSLFASLLHCAFSGQLSAPLNISTTAPI